MTTRRVIPIGIYGCKVVVTFTDNIAKELKKFHKKELCEYQSNTMYYGMSIPEVGTERYHIVLNSSSLDINTITHEAFHTAYAILDELGITLTKEHDEPLAYLLGHIVEKILGMMVKLEIQLKDGSSKKYKNK